MSYDHTDETQDTVRCALEQALSVPPGEPIDAGPLLKAVVDCMLMVCKKNQELGGCVLSLTDLYLALAERVHELECERDALMETVRSSRSWWGWRARS